MQKRTYCYTTAKGETIERAFPVTTEVPRKVRIRGRVAYRDYQAEHVRGTVKGTKNPTKNTWPMDPCTGSGVHASQAGELREFLEKRDCKTEITPSGDPIYTSAAHRRKALKLRGLHDRNSFD